MSIESVSHIEFESVAADRCLAVIVIIQEIKVIKGADRIELAIINGWQCVIKKGDFKVGDKVIYYCIDSIPDFTDPNAQSLVDMGIKRIKTIKIRGVISQGLLAPLKWLEDRGYDISKLVEDDDVTEQLGVRKYVSPDEISQYEKSDDSGNKYPSIVPKTDENRLQNKVRYLNEIVDRNIVITRKEDGCSCTFMYNEGKFTVCSRNFIVLPDIDISRDHYLILEKKFNISEKMTKFGKNIAIQGEAIGPKINGNKLKLDELTYRVFNIFDIEKQCYLLHDKVTEICEMFELEQVPVIYKGLVNNLTFKDKVYGTLIQDKINGKQIILSEFLKLADGIEYSKGNRAEGLVVKTDDDFDKRVSFKVISNNFLIANDKD